MKMQEGGLKFRSFSRHILSKNIRLSLVTCKEKDNDVRWAALTADLPALDMLMRLTCKEMFRSAVHVCKRLSPGRSKIQFAFIFLFSHQRCWIGHLQKSGQIQICGVSTVSLCCSILNYTHSFWLCGSVP